eukprot:12326443-Alexandrium_andersonii.AAC.1
MHGTVTQCTNPGQQASWKTATDKATPVQGCMNYTTTCTKYGVPNGREIHTDSATGVGGTRHPTGVGSVPLVGWAMPTT